MANQLGMAEQSAIIALARHGWSKRRIARELGLHRETVDRYLRAGPPVSIGPEDSKPAISTAGSEGPDESRGDATGGVEGPNRLSLDSKPAISTAGSSTSLASIEVVTRRSDAARLAGRRSECEPFREQIAAALEQGLSAQRIWQDLTGEHGPKVHYESVKRFVRRLGASRPLPFRRMECAPGDEAQIDFGAGAPIVIPDGRALPTGVTTRRRKTHVFRIVLSHSRKGCSEVVYKQTTDAFIQCIENAFHHFGGAPRTLVIDNLKAAVTKADWFDPDLNPKITAFAAHYGTVILPTKPYTPRHKGKIERGIGYVKDNALKGKTFPSLEEQNRYLGEWESGVADTRIHGTTRQQVGKVFEEVEHAALLPLPLERFPCFHEAQRVVSRDAHVEVDKAFYSVPPEHLGRTVWARWDARMVRIFDQRLQQIAVHAKGDPGRFRTQPEHIAAEKISKVEKGAIWLLDKASLIGMHAHRWCESMLQHRGIEGVRVLHGLINLESRYPSASIDQACEIAQTHGAYRLRVIRELITRKAPAQEQFAFIDKHPLIRDLSEYGSFVRASLQQKPWAPSERSHEDGFTALAPIPKEGLVF